MAERLPVLCAAYGRWPFFMFSFFRSKTFTFLEPVEQSMANLPDMIELLEQGRQDCLPFEPEDNVLNLDEEYFDIF